VKCFLTWPGNQITHAGNTGTLSSGYPAADTTCCSLKSNKEKKSVIGQAEPVGEKLDLAHGLICSGDLESNTLSARSRQLRPSENSSFWLKIFLTTGKGEY
jgi:hypothetical protein